MVRALPTLWSGSALSATSIRKYPVGNLLPRHVARTARSGRAGAAEPGTAIVRPHAGARLDPVSAGPADSPAVPAEAAVDTRLKSERPAPVRPAVRLPDSPACG